MINIYAPINILGYGIHATNMIKALSEAGEEINLTKIGQVQPDPYFEQYWKAAEQNLGRFDVKAPSLYIFHDEFSHQACGTPLMTFSIFETTKLKSLSKHMLVNGPTDIVLVTTKRHKELLLENGIDKPIEVVNEGVDSCIFNTIPVDRAVETDKFTFITVGKREVRKGTDDIIMSFIETMKDKEATFIGHTFNPFLNQQKDHPFKNLECWTGVNPQNHGFQYVGWVGKAHKFVNRNCEMFFTAPMFQTPEMASLYHSANIGIQVSRGEAWDLPLIELLACGVPTIASTCLGHSEYLTEALPAIQKDLLIEPLGKEKAADGKWFKEDVGEWDKPDFGKLRELIVETYENREKYEEKSDELSDHISDNFGWNSSVGQVRKVLDNYTN